MAVEIVVDRPLELGDAPEDAAPDALGGDLVEEALDEIEPGCAGRREVQLETRMLGELRLYLGRLVRSVVVEHEMDAEVLLHAPVDPPQEADELLGTVTRLAFADDEAALMRPDRQSAALKMAPEELTKARAFVPCGWECGALQGTGR